MQGKKEYLWDVDPPFRDWWKRYAHLNPGIDPRTITPNDLKIRLAFIPDGGSEIEYITPQALHRRKDMYAPVRKPRKLKDYPQFLEWYDPDLNPDIDPDTLLAMDNATLIKYRVRGSGEIAQSTPAQVSDRKDWSAPPRRPALLKDVDGLPELIEKYKDLNPHLEHSLDKLTANARGGERINLPDMQGGVYSILLNSFCHRQNPTFTHWPRVPVLEIPEFQIWLDHFGYLNQDVDWSTVTTATTTITIKFMVEGVLKMRTPFGVFRGGRDILKEIKASIDDDPTFWRYCTEKDRKRISTFYKSNNSQKMEMACSAGHTFAMTPRTFYEHIANGDEPCPYCGGRSRIVPGVNDALTVDPEIIHWLDDRNTTPPHMMPANSGHFDVFLTCPYCGYSFVRKTKNAVGKYPKCPVCKDTGIPRVEDPKIIMGVNIPYLMLMEEETKDGNI